MRAFERQLIMIAKKQTTSRPKLRFPEFSEEWEEKKIEDVLKIGSGKDYRHLGVGKVPVFGTGGLMLHVDQSLHNGETVFIGRKGTINKPFYFNGEFWTVDTLFFTHSFTNVTAKFIYNIFQKINWLLYNEASGVPSLSKSTIEKIKINIPSLSEQEKISSFLSTVDKWLGNLREQKNNLEKYKKGITKKIFSQEIRFKDENDKDFPEWEEKKLGKVSDFWNGKGHEQSISEQGKYIVINSRFISTDGKVKKYTDKQISPLCRDDIAVVMSDVPNGKALGKCFLVDEDNKYTLNQRIGGIRPTSMLSQFLIKILNRNKHFLGFDNGVSQTNLRKNEILNCKIEIPCIEEQKKISKFISRLDLLVDDMEQQIALLKKWKKGLLKQMFV